MLLCKLLTIFCCHILVDVGTFVKLFTSAQPYIRDKGVTLNTLQVW